MNEVLPRAETSQGQSAQRWELRHSRRRTTFMNSSARDNPVSGTISTNRLYLVSGSLVLSICITSLAATTEQDAGPGRLHRIDIKATHPKAYHPEIGDIVQCYMDFPIVPEQIVVDLRIVIEGKSVSLVAVASTSRPKIIGSGQISVFLLPRQPGFSEITILPVIPGQTPSPAKIQFPRRGKLQLTAIRRLTHGCTGAVGGSRPRFA